MNTPFIVAGLVSAITQFKLGRSTRKRFVVRICLWLFVFVGLLLAEPFYIWLLRNDFTRTEPLSLFDVVQITSIVLVFYIANQTRIKQESIERRLQDLHQELSIKLSTGDASKK